MSTKMKIIESSTIIFSLQLVLVTLFLSKDVGGYTIVASNTLRPMSEYLVAVTTADREGGFNLEIEGKGYRDAQQVTVLPYTTSLVTFKTGALQENNYTLTVRSVFGQEFLKRTPLRFQNKTYCVFVHTDKSVYAAKDVIHFRLLLLNMFLKPVPSLRPQITLKDGSGHVIKQWANVPLTKGVFSDDVYIADFPVLGDWTFLVEINEQTYTKHILVADFLLPKFNLKIEAPEHIYYADGSFPVTVIAEKFSGEEIVGELTLSAFPVYYSGVIQPVFQAPLRRVEQIRGRASFQLSLGNELQLREGEAAAGPGGRRLVVEAYIEEALTGRRHNVSRLLWLHRFKHQISYEAPKFYKPGLPYNLQIRVIDWENTNRKIGDVRVRYGFPVDPDRSNEMNMTEMTVPVQPDGSVMYSFNPDNRNLDLPLTIEILTNEVKEVIKGILPWTASKENQLQMELLTEMPSVGREVVVRVNSTKPMKSLSFYILGRGDIIHAKTTQIIPSKRVGEYRFQATHAMAPDAVIMVHHMQEGTEDISVASLQFQVHGVFQNNLDVRISPEQPEPLGNVDFNVLAEPDSYVALLAGPPSPSFAASSTHHYVAGQGDGLSEEIVLNELRSFTPNSGRSLMHQYRDIEGNDAAEIAMRSGVVILTDKTSNGVQFYGGEEPVYSFDSVTRPPLAGPYAFSRLPPPPSPRIHLGSLPLDTWLFSNLTVGFEGRGILGRRLPLSPGDNWQTGAWAVHPIKGLGFAKLVAPKMRMRPSLKISAPKYLREKETLALSATLSNPTQNEIVADITLNNQEREFFFEDMTNEVDSPKSSETSQRRRVRVPAQRTGTVVFFMSVPVSIEGRRVIILQLTASGVGISASYQHELTILPEGEEEMTTTSALLDMRTGEANANLSLLLLQRSRGRFLGTPAQATFTAEAWGWLLAPMLERLPMLASSPPPGGYHNMIPFMQAAIMMKALDESGQLSESVRNTAIDQMQKIFQQQMAYLRPDGSFSTTKGNSEEGSVWATGFAARWLSIGMTTGRREVGVPIKVVRDALKWLLNRQQPSGEWREPAALPIEDPLQQNTITLTALTLQTFLETKFLTGEEYVNVISKAQDWLARYLEDAVSEGATILAPVAAALALSRHPSAIQAINLLEQMANITDGKRWWEVDEEDKGNPLRGEGKSGRGLWTLSYGVQALILQGLRSDAMKAAPSLLAGLLSPSAPAPLYQAVSLLASTIPEAVGRVEFKCPNSSEITILNINRENNLLVRRELVRDRKCEVTSRGSGAVAATLEARRYTNVTAAWPRFTLDPRVDAVSTPHHLQLSVCIGFVAQSKEEISGPVFLEMRLPSGYELDIDIQALIAGGKVRSAKSGETLQMILAPLNRSESCLTLRAPRLHAVALEYPGVISLRDLNDDTRRARVFFTLGNSRTMCDVCWGERCQGNCASQKQRDPLAPIGQVATEDTAKSSSIRITLSHFITFTPLIVIHTIVKMLTTN